MLTLILIFSMMNMIINHGSQELFEHTISMEDSAYKLKDAVAAFKIRD